MKKLIAFLLIFLFIALSGCTPTNNTDPGFSLKATSNTQAYIYHRESKFAFSVEPENAKGDVTYQWSINTSVVSSESSQTVIILENVTGNTLTSDDLIYHFGISSETGGTDYYVNLLTQIADPGTSFNISCNATNNGQKDAVMFYVELNTDGTKDPNYNEDSSFYIDIDQGEEITYKEFLRPLTVDAIAYNYNGEVSYHWYETTDGSYNPDNPLVSDPYFTLPRRGKGTYKYVCVASNEDNYWSKQITIHYGDVLESSKEFIDAYQGSYSDKKQSVSFYNKNGKSYFEFTGLNNKKEIIKYKGEVIEWKESDLCAIVTIKITDYSINDDPCHPKNDTFQFVIYETSGYNKLQIVPTYEAVDYGFIVENIHITVN